MTALSITITHRRAAILIASLITLLGLGLRCHRLANQSFWIDEVYSITAARTPLDHIMAISAMPNNSLPTYFLLLRSFIGDSNENTEIRARLLSVIAGALTIPLFIALVFQWRRRLDIALAAGLLLAVNPLHIWYSQEARAYAVMLLFGVAALLCFEFALAPPPRRRLGWWLGYILSAAFAIALHKTAIIFPATCLLWHAWRLRDRPPAMRALLIHLAILIAGVTILSAKSIVLPAESLRPHSILELLYTAITYLGGYSFGPSLIEIQTYGPIAAVARSQAQLAILAIVLLLVALPLLRSWRSLLSSRAAALLLLDILMVTAYTLKSNYPFNVRYTLPGLLGFLALAAELLPLMARSWLPRAALPAMIALSLWADFQWYYSPRYRKEDARAAALWIIAHRDHVASWTMIPYYSAAAIQYYLYAMSHAELNPRLLPPPTDASISFPPTPDILILGRRDRIANPPAVIAAYRSATHNDTPPISYPGIDIFPRL